MTPQCLWFTGLSGAGKSTVARLVDEKLKAQGEICVVLDADQMRGTICKDLGFSVEDRSENVRRIAELARRFVEAGAIVLVACIAPFTADRSRAREIIGPFTEVFMDAPLAICEQRDVKGLYARARRGELQEFTGIDSPYEAPLSSDLRLRTDQEDAEVSAARVIVYLQASTREADDSADAVYDPRERAREKQAARDRDADDLASGRKTREQLARENSPFAAVLGRVDFSQVGLPGYKK